MEEAYLPFNDEDGVLVARVDLSIESLKELKDVLFNCDIEINDEICLSFNNAKIVFRIVDGLERIFDNIGENNGSNQ